MSELSKVRHPPARLSWPSGLGKKKSSTSTKAAADTKANSRKRPRFSSTFTSTADSTAMWVDRFTPSSSTELCVASKRVKEIKAWIEEALSENTKKLLVLVGNPGVGKSTCIHVLAKELSIDVLSWNESYVPRNEDSFRNPGLLSVEQSSPIDSFSEFLQQSGTGFSSLQLSSSDLNSVNQKSIILLEDLPNIHGFDAAQRFRKIMSQHLQRSLVPTVLIFSDVTEGKHKPVDLERLVNQTDLYSPITCCIRQVHPVTKQKMKKSLEKIAKQLKFKTSPNLLEELNLQSGGDLRHAIMNLQLHATGINSSESRDCKNFQSNNRDVKLSNFHALGKLLYAKRTTKEGRSMLAFDPEEILERSDLGMGGSLRFLEYHSADFFTDITELSDCYELYSDASTLLDHPDRYSVNAVSFLDEYAASVAGRAVAHTNTQPTPNKFRQFSTPKVFDVLRKRRENERLLEQLSRRLSNSHLSLSNSVGCTSTFITDTLPAMRMIVPDDVNPQVDNLYSIRMGGQGNEKCREQTEIDRGFEEQAAILEIDDIVDFSSDDNCGDDAK